MFNKGLYVRTVLIRSKLIFNKKTINGILLFLCFFLVGIYSYEKENKKIIKIGFIYNENKEVNKIIEEYEHYSQGFFKLIRYTTNIQLKKDVATNKIDCGYEFLGDSTIEDINLYKSNKTITSNINNIFLGSLLTRNESGAIGYKVIKKYLDAENISVENIKKEIEMLNEKNLESIKLLDIEEIEIKDGVTRVIEKENNKADIFYNLVGLFIFLFTLLFYENEIKEKNSLIYDKLENENKQTYYFGNFTSYFIFLFLFGIVATLVIKKIFTLESDFLNLLLGTIIFSSISSTLVYILTKINKNHSSIIIVFYFITSLLLANVFFEVEKYIKILAIAKYFYPVFYFKLLINGEITVIVSMLCIVIVTNLIIYIEMNKEKEV